MNGKRYRWDCIIDRVPRNQPTIGAEVGVWRGKCSRHLLASLPLLTLHMIDRWAPPDEEDSYYTSGSEIARHGEHIFNEAFQEAWQETHKYGDRAVMYKEESAVAAMHFPVCYFDFVFIDSDHSYEGVKKAIAEWAGKVRYGGILGFHDYGHPEQGEVKRAVDEAFQQVETDENHTAFVRIS